MFFKVDGQNINIYGYTDGIIQGFVRDGEKVKYDR